MAKPNDKQQQITGFHLGGLIPLDRVGYVLAALYEHGAENLQIAPLASDFRPQGSRRRVSDTSGIAGLLPAPSGGEPEREVIGPDPMAALIEIVSKAPARGMKKNDIVRQLEDRGVDSAALEGPRRIALVRSGVLKSMGFGLYVLGPNAGQSGMPPEKAATPPNGGISKKQIMLDYIVSCGGQGCQRVELLGALAKHGFGSPHFDNKPLQQLLNEKKIISPKRGHYIAVNAGPVASVPARTGGKKTLRSSILDYLTACAPQSRTRQQISAHVIAEVGTTIGGVGHELGGMFAKKLVARPTTGVYTLPPA